MYTVQSQIQVHTQVVSDRTEPDMSFGPLEPDKSPAQLKSNFWLEPLSRTLNDIAIKITFSASKQPLF